MTGFSTAVKAGPSCAPLVNRRLVSGTSPTRPGHESTPPITSGLGSRKPGPMPPILEWQPPHAPVIPSGPTMIGSTVVLNNRAGSSARSGGGGARSMGPPVLAEPSPPLLLVLLVPPSASPSSAKLGRHPPAASSARRAAQRMLMTTVPLCERCAAASAPPHPADASFLLKG